MIKSDRKAIICETKTCAVIFLFVEEICVNSAKNLVSKKFIFILILLFANFLYAENLFVEGEVIVKMKSQQSRNSQKLNLSKLSNSIGLKMVKSFPSINMHQMKVKGGQNLEDAIAKIRENTNVEFVEPNFYFKKINNADSDGVIQSYSKEDVVAGFKTNSANTYQQTGVNAHVTEAWSKILSVEIESDNKPIIAVIDTGVDYSHSVFKLSNAIWTNPNEIPGNNIDDDQNGFIDDVNGWNFFHNSNDPYDDDGHGTHVAGIVLGVTIDIFADTLKESPIRIMPLKFLGADGSGTTAQAIEAINYAILNGAKVINNSWGGYNYSASLHSALAEAYKQGVFIVTAAGNSTNDNDSKPIYPANLSEIPSLISVAASNDWDSIAYFSNYGVQSVQVTAPGVSVLSTLPRGRYGYASGTSMAAPFVAGLAGLIIREAPDLSGFQLRQILIENVEPISKLKAYVSSSGRVDVLASLDQGIISSKTQSFQPNYDIVYRSEARSPASEGNSNSKNNNNPMGCGTVGKLFANSSSENSMNQVLLMSILFLPVVVWSALKRKSMVSDNSKRRYDRFALQSQIQLQVGGRSLTANMKTISVGGLSFNADTLIEKGGLISMTITSPDGRESIQVDGNVVWNEQNKSYGVQFNNVKEGVKVLIQNWSEGLKKV